MTRGPRWRGEVLGLIVALGGMFVYFSHQPLWHTDLWGHLAYGRWIEEHSALPATEPFMPLSREVPVVNTAWLSQLAGYVLFSVGGVPGLQVLYAGLVTVTACILMAACNRRFGGAAVALSACAIFLLVDWRQLQVIRPQLAGLACFVALLARRSASPVRRADWWFVPGLFVAWANLHGSFLVGLGLLASMTAGRAGDRLWRCRDWRAAFRDRHVRRGAALTVLAAAAVLVNPYGPALYGEVFALMRHPNLAALTEWWPLSWRSFEGRAFAGVSVLLAIVVIRSRRRVRLEELLPVLGLGAATFWHSRMILWWGPVAAWFFARHAPAVLRRWRIHRFRQAGNWCVSSKAVIGTVLGTMLVGFAFSPAGIVRLSDSARGKAHGLSAFTPVEVADFLATQPQRGLVFNTYEWGDYFVWRDPDLPVLLTSHAHLVPPAVWNDYLRVIRAEGDWTAVFDRLNIETIVLDKARRGPQIAVLRASGTWVELHEDRLAVVFVRNTRLRPAGA